MSSKILNLGCGESGKSEGILNVDIREIPNVDVVADVRKLPFKDGEIEGIVNRNLIEHFGRHEIEPLLKEWNRVLQKGGFLNIETVDVGSLMDKWKDIPEENMLDGILGAQTYPENFHKMLFTKDSLESFLRKTGFNPLEVQQFESREIPRIIIKSIKI